MVNSSSSLAISCATLPKTLEFGKSYKKDLAGLSGTTLKAFANSSPGFALKPWVQKTRKNFFATLKELRNGDATLSELRLLEMNACSPGLPKRNPGLELANAFSVVRRTLSFRTVSSARCITALKT
jgi:hypothetical protein